mgnify:CR=1 FL=1
MTNKRDILRLREVFDGVKKELDEKNREYKAFQTDTLYFDNLKKIEFTLVGIDPCKKK